MCLGGFYCDASCQHEHWENHKSNCKRAARRNRLEILHASVWKAKLKQAEDAVAAMD
jgi:hypothetical protein